MLLRVDGSGHQAAQGLTHTSQEQGNKEFAGCDAVSFPISSATARDSFLKPVEP